MDLYNLYIWKVQNIWNLCKGFSFEIYVLLLCINHFVLSIYLETGIKRLYYEIIVWAYVIYLFRIYVVFITYP